MSKYKLKDAQTDAWSAEALCDICNDFSDLAQWPSELRDPLISGELIFMDRGQGKYDSISVGTSHEGTVVAVSKQDMVIYTTEGILSVTSITKFNSKFDKV